MNWKFWKRQPKEELIEISISTREVPFSTLYRWYCYDTGLDDLDELDDIFGLTPISEEAKTMEEEDSEKRLATIEPLHSFIRVMSNINASVITENEINGVFDALGLDENDERVIHTRESLEHLINHATFVGLVAAFSSAIELNLVAPATHIISEVDYDERF